MQPATNRERRAPDPILPFGKYKGQAASEVPVEYLDWLIGQDWLYVSLREEIYEHLLSRAEWQQLDDAAVDA